ncbi:MAG: guanylate kinase [Saprospiraceae bacterium]|nr:guanylate kinase [Saprospiraceae bacterium]
MSVERFEGKMFIFTAPSGAGKTTIVRHLLEKYDFLGFSISATTRAKRDYEIDGKDYYFMSVETFKERVANGDFVEWEEVYHGQFYGTLKSEVERIWAAGKHLVFDIDVRGAQNLKKIYTNKCMSVFVRPPSVQVLIQRLIQRNTETAESLEKRLNKVKREMVFENTFDIVLVNDLLEISLKEAEHIISTFILGFAKKI